MSSALNYMRLYADSAGESHFEPAVVETSTSNFAPPAPAFNVSRFLPALRNGFLLVPAAWSGDLHPSPLRMWIFVLDGEMEFEASDGERQPARKGDALLLEDTTGRGHRSRVIGDTAAKLAVVELEPEPDRDE
ncbi:cupin domain-containing protein [Paraburkholderia sp. RL17-373-BIF-A]|uniref:cupin domain-containing protein n=1 Tax=Paraburkholderia sp. RL17-373-BIF-A TaxID=3031629 RepID=UPI0038B6F2BF